MAGDAERLEILEMVQATQTPVCPTCRLEVVDLEPLRRALPPPGPHRRTIRALAGILLARRTRGWSVPAAATAIAVAALRGPPRHRPPMVGPKGIPTRIATPRPPPGWKRRPTPPTPLAPLIRQRTGCEERSALRGAGGGVAQCAPGRPAAMGCASSAGELVPSRNAPSEGIENCMPVQNCPNSPKREDASSKRIS